MSIKLFDEVVLGRDIPEDRLKAGDIATLVDIVPGPAGESQGAVLEVFNAIGETICVTTVSLTDIHPLTADVILSARPLPKAG
jgi:hypothetical protein